jgi:hypothetical protein
MENINTQRTNCSLFIGPQLVEILIDHVFNVIWAKGVIRKMPDYVANYIVTEAGFIANSHYKRYDPRLDDKYIFNNQNTNNDNVDDGTDEPNTGGADAYFKCIVKH